MSGDPGVTVAIAPARAAAKAGPRAVKAVAEDAAPPAPGVEGVTSWCVATWPLTY